MINRIRSIRKEKGMTLAELAVACDPATTPQTVGRLETGTRTLSTAWIDRIAKALGVKPESLIRSESADAPEVIAALTNAGAEALAKPREAILPSELAGNVPIVCLVVEASQGEYREGDQLWLRRADPDEAGSFVNRDVLVPRAGGRFAFGRLIDRQGTLVGILPPGVGQKQQVVDNPPWLAIATMLVRPL
ncbi:helix-turn-helix transcriptional regulator [Alteriqipengyuania flavescens]|uniref:helix-turn-helix domain-containing protein n=1 Tax=Alteriqipengyuania flavescens TaxID=3053610 RepID=UPI0025B5FCF3|nr:helix-turn-helix transcriptional regulator [Alteriqipengyuania flavescens]WJY18628.1 helix-turn-helix transcriptional regulator [Alteriqipengyuania flavescens]WJY24568.1 helix-turn-helix transcriptional regulator [Alteriqipengyuania flavescens]